MIRPTRRLASNAFTCVLLLLAASLRPSVANCGTGGTGPCTPCDYLRSELARRQMDERGEATTDAYVADALGNTKHKPYLRIEGTTAIVLVGLGAVTGRTGDAIHPMSYSDDANTIHWIDTVWAEDQDKRILAMRRLSPTEAPPATLVFEIPANTTRITAYQHCNKHGMFKGTTLRVDAVQTVSGLAPACNITGCGSLSQDMDVCSAHVAEYWRLHAREFSKNSPVDGNTNLKHKPTLILNGDGTAIVKVGEDNRQSNGDITYHPMSPSAEPSAIHWINAIWVMDQAGNLVAMRGLEPTEPSPATLTFDVPASATKLTAYEYCNKHGLFSGGEVVVPSGSTKPSVTEGECGLRECPGKPKPVYAQDADCDSLVAETKRRQLAMNAQSPLAFPESFTEGSKNEKHSPYIVLNGTVAKVVVGRGAAGFDGEPIHPMVDDPTNFGANLHYIDTIWVEDQNGRVLAYRSLSASEPKPATLYFDIPEGTTKVQAYEFCNTHGWFQGPAVDVLPANIRPGARAGCSVQQCVEGAGVSTCQGFISEFLRRMGTPLAKNDASGKHKPYLSINGTTATIVVGIGATVGNEGGLIHPMSPSDDPNIVHFIGFVYALDELGNLVHMCELLPTHPAPARCTFEVPPGIQFMKPYEWCNKHGLYVGEAVTVTSFNPAAKRQCRKRECTESHPSLSAEALSSAAVEAAWDSAQDSTERISTTNMCRETRAIFAVQLSDVDASSQVLLDSLTAEGDAASDIARRLELFPAVMGQLIAKGGAWHGHPDGMEHALVNPTTLRTELLDEKKLRFSQRVLKPGQQAFADGVKEPIENATDLLLIDASFAMDWGYTSSKNLGAHMAIFYSLNFTSEIIDVALCGKTHGWMGVGWLGPSHMGHYMNHTDMTVAFVDSNGMAVVQDRFAVYIEEPLRDEKLPGQRADDPSGFGRNDLRTIPGALGMEGKEWCPDEECKQGFTLVQFTRNFTTPDLFDVQLPVRTAKIGMIHGFSNIDPTDVEMVQHIMSTTGYVDLPWNLDCPAGTYFDINLIECIRCDVGSFRPATSAATRCLQCPSGTYQDMTGQETCKACKDGFTTVGVGATNERACLCSGPSMENRYGTYHVPTCGDGPSRDAEGEPLRCAYLGECLPCPTGMFCRGGRDLTRPVSEESQARVREFCSSFAFSLTENCSGRSFCAANWADESCSHTFPELKRGYWSTVESPLFVYQCHSTDRAVIESLRCPGGYPGPNYCAERVIGPLCTRCEEGYAPSLLSANECTPCAEVEWIYMVIILIIPIVALSVVYQVSNSSISTAPTSTLAMSVSVGTFATVATNLSIFGSMSISLPDMFSGNVDSLSFLTADFGGLRFQCMGITGLGLYCFPLVTALSIPVYFVLRALLEKALSRYIPQRFQLTKDKVINTGCVLFLAAFVPLILACVAPFTCYSHPASTEANPVSTLVKFPSVHCGTAEHASFVVVGIFGLLVYAVPFVSLSVWATWHAHEKCWTEGYKVRFRYLFYKFSASRYYWALFILLRSSLLGFTPVISPNDPFIQILYMSIVILIALTAQAFMWPWKLHLLNMVELSAFFIMALICLTSVVFTHATEEQQALNEQVSVVVILVLLLSFATIVAIATLDGSLAYLKREILKRPLRSQTARAAKAKKALTHIRGSLMQLTEEDIEEFSRDVSEDEWYLISVFWELMHSEIVIFEDTCVQQVGSRVRRLEPPSWAHSIMNGDVVPKRITLRSKFTMISRKFLDTFAATPKQIDTAHVALQEEVEDEHMEPVSKSKWSKDTEAMPPMPTDIEPNPDAPADNKPAAQEEKETSASLSLLPALPPADVDTGMWQRFSPPAQTPGLDDDDEPLFTG
eukprot:TRINITY_DN8104_c0_g2_i1.p1 TRINITY_DN8104_c0_g2~~TRINITY_DN8104_c0_g2_i1.p1  ORF type:complete len:1846 (+),score=294.15 TRINITY_DN8104_c0_g2_i1:63-5600(+)